jgi:hypothetical protein
VKARNAKQELSPKRREEPLATLRARFEKNMQRHPGVEWAMGLAGALSGALAGVVVQGLGYPMLTLLAALATMPLAVLATLRTEGRAV